MRATVKSIEAGDDGEDLSVFQPANDTSFCVELRILIGTGASEGADAFSLTVVTPNWLLENPSPEGVINGRHKLIVFSYNRILLTTWITRMVERCHGNSWEEVAEKVGRIAYWEFEDYQEYRG